ncbi:MAG: GNAT family N-acetyltransferase [Chlamydiales bacterium]|nr:GNAT family N-acetyltransferase [Chlamydiales bacterium]
MSNVIVMNAAFACTHSNHLFSHPLCENQTFLRRVANVVFHILTLGIPLAAYYIVVHIFPRDALNPIPVNPTKIQAIGIESVEEATTTHSSSSTSITTSTSTTTPSTMESGIACIYSKKENEEIPVTIVRKDLNYGVIKFEAHLGKELLGHIKVDWIRILAGRGYGSKNYSNLSDFDDYYGYGRKNIGEVDKIIVEELFSLQKQKYKGIGTALMQAAMEYGYANHCEGRLLLEASWKSHGFYYKLGMRTRSSDIDAKIASQLEESFDKLNKDHGSCVMYMPKKARQNWVEKIRAKPIFLQTMQYLPT